MEAGKGVGWFVNWGVTPADGGREQKMKSTFTISLLAVFLAAVSVCVSPDGSAAGDTERLVVLAREKAAADMHEESIRHFLTAVRLDSALAGELGKEIGLQYTWSDKPDSAAAWFRIYLKRNPDDLEGMLGLARALSWAGEKSESIEWYRRIQGKYPEAIDARIGEARVVSWQDRNKESEALYRKILEADPRSLEASLGLAQVVNWQGRHREAATLYGDIMESHPDSKEAVIGLAQAQRWLGLDWKARKTLAPVKDHPEAAKMLEELETEAAPAVRTSYAVSSDSDDLVINRLEVFGFHGMGEGTRTGIGISELWMDQKNAPPMKRDGAGVHYSRRFNEDWALNMNIVEYYHTVDGGGPLYSNGDGFDAFCWSGWVTWTPHWRFRADVSSSRSTVETPLSVAREITYRESGAGLDVLIGERLKSVSGYSFRSYSDGNSRNLLRTALEWKLLSSPMDLGISPGYTYFTFGEWKPNGYYNPDEYHNWGLKLTAGSGIGPAVYVRMEGSISREKEGDGDFFTVGSFTASVEWKAGRNFRAGGEFFTSNSRVSGEAGYSRTLGGVYAVILF